MGVLQVSTEVVNQAASVDWNIVAGAVATFFVTAWVAWSGRQKAKKEDEKTTREIPAILTGATLQDNYTMIQLADAHKQLAAEIKLLTYVATQINEHLIEAQVEMRRLTDALRP